METQEIDITKLSTSELEQLLENRKKEENAALEKRKKDYIQKRDGFIKGCIAQANHVNAELNEFKKHCVSTGNELHDLMFEVFQKEPKELKTFSLITDDGKFKVEIDRAERQNLNETAEVHIATIKEVFKEKFAPRNKTMYNILDTILVKNGKGEYDERLVAKLRKYEADIDDPRFSEALDGLAKAYYVSGSSTYARFYIKDEEKNCWNHINIQFSSL